MKIDGIVFDLDGTLWDSTQVVSDSWGETLRRRYGADHWPDRDAVRSIMGMTASQIAETLFSEYGAEAEAVCRACIHGENEYLKDHCGDVYNGVDRMLSILSERFPLFIVSNCLDGYIQCFLKATGFYKYIKDFESEGGSGLPKAGNIRLVCERNSVFHPIYIGDTEMDEKSAAEAGCPFVHVSYGFGRALSPAAVAAHPEDLIDLISALEGRDSNA